MKSSRNLEGNIGKPIAVSDFPTVNLTTNMSRYAMDGNWAFCRFDDEEIIGARFGLNRGFFSTTDYGLPSDQPDDGCSLRVEILTREGAYLWIENNKFKARDVIIPDGVYKHDLVSNGREILSLSGWPVVNWRMKSDEGFLAIESVLEPEYVLVLPDNLTRNMRFSMWLTACPIRSIITIGDTRKEVSGMAFYDHPRVSRERNDVPEFGSYNYVPAWLDDGSYLISYYSENANGVRNDNYSFAWHIDGHAKCRKFTARGNQMLTFDQDGQIETCQSGWVSNDAKLTINVCAEPLSVTKVWGTGNIPKTRKQNRVFPLPFRCDALFNDDGGVRKAVGIGLNEYIRNPAFGEANIMAEDTIMSC